MFIFLVERAHKEGSICRFNFHLLGPLSLWEIFNRITRFHIRIFAVTYLKHDFLLQIFKYSPSKYLLLFSCSSQFFQTKTAVASELMVLLHKLSMVEETKPEIIRAGEKIIYSLATVIRQWFGEKNWLIEFLPLLFVIVTIFIEINLFDSLLLRAFRSSVNNFESRRLLFILPRRWCWGVTEGKWARRKKKFLEG